MLARQNQRTFTITFFGNPAKLMIIKASHSGKGCRNSLFMGDKQRHTARLPSLVLHHYPLFKQSKGIVIPMNEFYNPYHFIPVTGKVNGKRTKTMDFSLIKVGKSKCVRHDMWEGTRKSGRIVCSLTLETPTVVGNQHKTNVGQETEIEPYKLPSGEYAIPANSLRGMVASIAEALSQSALRVLDQKRYSIRKEVSSVLSAIGYVKVKKDSEGRIKYYLIPLTLPTIPKINLNASKKYEQKWIDLFGKESNLSDYMSAYVNGYRYDNDSKRLSPTVFLKKNITCNNFSNPTYYYAKLHNELRSRTVDSSINADYAGLYLKPIPKKGETIGHSCLGQKIINQDIITQAQYEERDKEKQNEYTRGVLFVFGINGREENVPHTKNHERFVPIPQKDKLTIRELEIPKKVFEGLLYLANERHKTDESLPFLPQGYDPKINSENQVELPCDGDMVYFDIDSQGQITEISYSSIWRKSIEGTIHDAFANIYKDSNDISNLIPWGYGKRKALTPAEWLFGVVEGGNKKKVKEEETGFSQPPRSKNLASRVRFYDARCPKPITLECKKYLKILSSPKPPSPAMYFKNGPKKAEIKKIVDYTPNGRKYYLPHANAQYTEQDAEGKHHWETKSDEFKDQKCYCTPIPKGSTFYFHIDFDNLSNDELHLLRTALHPNDEFRHRLGLGKPLGLGSVFVNILGIFCVNRIKRYGEDSLQNRQRYHELFCKCETWPSNLSENWQLYHIESKAFGQLESQNLEDGKLVDTESLEWLRFFGNPNSRELNVKVHYPLSTKQCNSQEVKDKETEGFKWFVNNDHKNNSELRRCLTPAQKNEPLQPLKGNPDPPQRRN